MPRIEDRELRNEVLAKALKIHFDKGDERVALMAFWRTYQGLAADAESIGSVGGFARYVRSEGLATVKQDGKSLVLLDEAARDWMRRQLPSSAPVPASDADLEARLAKRRNATAQHAPLAATGSPLVRVDTPVLLHHVAEGMDGLFDLQGKTEAMVLEDMRELLEQASLGVADKAVRLGLLSGAMALNGSAA